MDHQEFIPKKNKSASSSEIYYDRILLNRDEKFQHPFTVIFIKESLPIRIINGINGKNKGDVYKELNQYSFSREVSKDEFEKHRFLASKISTLGIDSIYKKEFIKQVPRSFEIEEENKQLIEDKNINSQIAVNQYVQKSDFVIIENEEKFNELLSEEKAVLYIQIDWSGVERIGRVKIVDTLSEKHFDNLTKYMINHSNGEYQFFNHYIREYNEGIGRLTSYGSGEILLVEKGKIIDYIERGFLINRQNLNNLFKKWMTINEIRK